MKNEQEQLEALQDIRKMMKESSKFLSLSGLSGVFAGVYALLGAWYGYQLLLNYLALDTKPTEYSNGEMLYAPLLIKMVLVCIGVLVLSIVTALYLSSKKAKTNNQRLFDHTSKKILWCMMVPLFAGGVFCLALLLNGTASMLSPVMLLFYGLALINSSKYTLHEVKYLGYLQVVLGMIAGFYPGHGLFFWALGFGVLHIIYGSIMWFKYDRVK